MVLLAYFLIAGIAVTLSAPTTYSQVLLDDQIQRLREGKKVTISDVDFLKARTEQYDKFLGFAADLYIEQVKWSLISPKKHGGWPVRSFVIEEPDWIADIYRNLKKKAEQTDDSLIDYALICPALYMADEPEVQRLLARLEKKDQFLYKQAHVNLDRWWRVEVAKRLRARR
jgi:hypothetical protein